MSYGPKRSKRSSKKFAHFLSLQVSDCICITIKQAKKKIQPEKKRRLWEDWYFCFYHGIHKKKSSWKTVDELKTESKEREKSPRKANILMDQLVALIPVEVQVDTGCASPGYVPVQSRGKPRLSHYLLSNEIPISLFLLTLI